MRRISRTLAALVLCLGAVASGGALLRAHEGEDAPAKAKRPEAPAEEARAKARWKAFREHIEKAGRKDLLPEESPDGKAPAADAIIGILFRMSPDLAAAHDLLDSEPADVAGARARLDHLGDAKDPYIADYAGLLGARADLLEKRYPEAVKGYEKVLGSSRNLATPAARRGLAESYRGLRETTLEILELRLLLGSLPPDGTADRSWAEGRLAEIRREHPGPLHDSAKRMDDLSTRLTAVETAPGLAGEQRKVEDILLKIAKILDDEAKRCLLCMSTACKPCKSCGSCSAAGKCPGGECPGSAPGAARNGQGDPKGEKDDGDPAKRSSVAKGKPSDAKLRESKAKDSDVWGNVNEREVAKALQDIWGKIPPAYRQVVAQYFKDISGLEEPGSAPAPKQD